MIRFINLEKQYWLPGSDDPEYFSFIDTISDRFVEANGEQFWECWDDFEEDYNAGEKWRGIELERFKSLVNPIFFRPTSPIDD